MKISKKEQDTLKRFGKRLATLRKESGLTQQQLAEKVDMSVVAIAYIETGKRWPRLFTIKKISKALGVKTEEFFKGV